jgi:predicted secreted protein
VSRTYDHDSGEAVDEDFLAKNAGKIAATVAAATVPVVLNSPDAVKVATKILSFIGKNPKVALGFAAIAGSCYVVHRLTEPGTKFKKNEEGFEYERS